MKLFQKLKGTSEQYSTTFLDNDNDGDLDMFGFEIGGIIANKWAVFLNYFENTGSASSPVFGNPTPAIDDDTGEQLTLLTMVAFPTACDFDEDGDVDLVIGSGMAIDYYENVGDNRFKYSDTFVTKDDYSTLQVTLGDLNKDGAIDMVFIYADYVIGGQSAKVYVKWGN